MGAPGAFFRYTQSQRYQRELLLVNSRMNLVYRLRDVRTIFQTLPREVIPMRNRDQNGHQLGISDRRGACLRDEAANLSLLLRELDQFSHRNADADPNEPP